MHLHTVYIPYGAVPCILRFVQQWEVFDIISCPFSRGQHICGSASGACWTQPMQIKVLGAGELSPSESLVAVSEMRALPVRFVHACADVE